LIPRSNLEMSNYKEPQFGKEKRKPIQQKYLIY